MSSVYETITCDQGWQYDTSQYKSSIVSEVRTSIKMRYEVVRLWCMMGSVRVGYGVFRRALDYIRNKDTHPDSDC